MVAKIEVKGLDRLDTTMSRAERQLETIDTTEATKIIAAAGQTEAPKRSGRLAYSIRPQGAGTITSPLVYSVPIHWGRPAHNITANPFLVRAVERTEDRWTHSIEQSGQKICNGVQGA